MAEVKETSKKERAKEYVVNHKKSFIGIGVLLVLWMIYIFTGQEVEYQSVLDKLCSVTGWC